MEALEAALVLALGEAYPSSGMLDSSPTVYQCLWHTVVSGA